MKDFFEFEELIEDLPIDFNYDFQGNENKSSFSAELIVQGVGMIAEGTGDVAMAIAKKKEAEARIVEIGGKRQAQLKDCENNKSFKKILDRKYRNNRIKDCQDEVKKRLNAEEQEQKDIVRRMASLEEGKILSDIQKKSSEIEEKKAGKKLYVVGGIIALALVLGTIVYIKKRK
jgi:hypothetical protein